MGAGGGAIGAGGGAVAAGGGAVGAGGGSVAAGSGSIGEGGLVFAPGIVVAGTGNVGMSGGDAPGNVVASGSVLVEAVPTGAAIGDSVVVVTSLVVVTGSVVVVTGSVVVVAGWVVVVTGSVVVVVSGSVKLVLGAAIVLMALCREMPAIGVGCGGGVTTTCVASVEVGYELGDGSNVPGWVVDVAVVLVEDVIRGSELVGPIRSGMRRSTPSVRPPGNSVITMTPISARTTPLDTATMVDR